jgi:hypothetical protein
MREVREYDGTGRKIRCRCTLFSGSRELRQHLSPSRLIRRSTLSPNGQLGAVAPAQRSVAEGTNVCTNGTLTGAVPGFVGGGLDDSRLLVSRYLNDKYGTPFFDRVEVMSTMGVVQASLQILPVSSIQVVSANSFYEPSVNKIYDATTGAVLFSTSDTPLGKGAVSGANVVFGAGSLVRIETR